MVKDRPAHRPVRLLVADDSSDLRIKVIEALANGPYVEVVGETADVLSTLEAIDRLRPDAVLLDIQMPGGSGIDVLRQVGRTIDRPVFIVLTNHPHDHYRRAGQELRANFFLDKSRDLDRLTDVLRRISVCLTSGQIVSEVY